MPQIVIYDTITGQDIERLAECPEDMTSILANADVPEVGVIIHGLSPDLVVTYDNSRYGFVDRWGAWFRNPMGTKSWLLVDRFSIPVEMLTFEDGVRGLFHTLEVAH